jgi:hypothetical protein
MFVLAREFEPAELANVVNRSTLKSGIYRSGALLRLVMYQIQDIYKRMVPVLTVYAVPV